MFFVSDSIFAQSRNLTVAIIIDYEFPFSVGESQTSDFVFLTLVCVAIIYCVFQIILYLTSLQ